MRRSLSLIVLIALACACSNVCWDDDEARAAALRYVRELSASSASTFYVVVDGGTPSKRFFNCLPPEDSSLVPATEATHDFVTMRVRDGAAPESVTLWVDDYDQTGEDHARIEAGYQRADGTSKDFKLALRKVAGRWKVTGPR